MACLIKDATHQVAGGGSNSVTYSACPAHTPIACLIKDATHQISGKGTVCMAGLFFAEVVRKRMGMMNPSQTQSESQSQTLSASSQSESSQSQPDINLKNVCKGLSNQNPIIPTTVIRNLFEVQKGGGGLSSSSANSDTNPTTKSGSTSSTSDSHAEL